MAKRSNNEEFGKMLNIGLTMLAACSGLKKGAVEEDLAACLELKSKKTIETWQREGTLIPDDILLTVAEYFIDGVSIKSGACKGNNNLYFTYAWMEKFFEEHGTRCISQYLQLLFPDNEASGIKNSVINNLPQQEYSRYIERNKVDKKLINAMEGETAVVFLDGFAGNGKSSCAYNFAKKIIDGIITSKYNLVIWISDKGSGNFGGSGKVNLDKLFTAILKTLGIESSSLRFTAKSEKVISLLYQHNCLILVDNYETIEGTEITEFLSNNLPINCKAIITSRQNFEDFPELSNCIRVKIPGMEKQEVTELLWAIAKNDSDAISPLITNDLIDDLMAITNGNPFAVKSIFGAIISELKTGNSYSVIIDGYRKFKSDLYSGIFDSLLNKLWSMLSSDAQTLLTTCSLFPKSVSGSALRSITEWDSNRIVATVEECQAVNFLETAFEQNNATTGVRYSLHPLVFGYLQEALEEDVRDFWFKKIVSYYKTFTKKIGFCYDHLSDMNSLDGDGEFEALSQVLDYCESHGLDSDFVEISNNTKYYYYIRGYWWSGDKSIHIRRSKAAKRNGQIQDEFDAIVYHVNCAAKRKEVKEAEQYIALANALFVNNENRLRDEEIIEFYHAKALFHYSKQDYEQALILWNENFNVYSEAMNPHDYNANSRWRAKCLFKIGGLDNDAEAVEVLTQAASVAKSIGFLRGYLDSYLALGEYYSKNEANYEVDRIVSEIEHGIIESRDKRYLAELRVLQARVAESNKDIESLRHYLCDAKDILKLTHHNQRLVELMDEFVDYVNLIV